MVAKEAPLLKPVTIKTYLHSFPSSFKNLGRFQLHDCGSIFRLSGYCNLHSFFFIGYATRRCIAIDSTMAKWSNFIDTSDCVSMWVLNIDREVRLIF